MAIFASTTTSGYSDPLKAMTIKALEKRQADMLAQQAQQQPDAAMMATIPGGIGHVLGQVGDRMAQARNEQAIAAQRDMLAKAITGYDPDSGPPPAAVATTDPELYKSLLSAWAENRRARETNQITSRGQDVTARGQDVTAGTAARGQDIDARGQDVTARGQDVVAASTARGQDITARGQDIVSGDTQRGQDVTIRGQDVVSTDTRRGQDVTTRGQDITARGQDIVSQDTARGQDITARGQDVGAGTAIRGQDVQARGQDVGADVAVRGQDIQQGTTVRGQDIGADTTVRGQDVQARGQDMQAATAAAQQASQERIAAQAAAAKAAETASDPKRAGEVAALGTQYAQQAQAVEKLEKAVNILNNGGINTGPWARAETVAANLANGRFGTDKEMAQRTTDFNSLINEATIKTMSETLKGQTTNFEMDKFLEVMNNPNASPEARKEGVERLLNAAKIGRDLSREAVRKTGGNADLIDGTLRGGGGASATGGGALQEAQNAINQGAPFDAVVKRLQDAGHSAAGLKQKGM